jgi:hypothetical protein
MHEPSWFRLTQQVLDVSSQGVELQSGTPASVNSTFETTRALDELELLPDPDPPDPDPPDPDPLPACVPLELELEPPLDPDGELPELEPPDASSSPWSELDASSAGRPDALLLQATSASAPSSAAERRKRGCIAPVTGGWSS